MKAINSHAAISCDAVHELLFGVAVVRSLQEHGNDRLAGSLARKQKYSAIMTFLDVVL
jgi:hypothetical protein